MGQYWTHSGSGSVYIGLAGWLVPPTSSLLDPSSVSIDNSWPKAQPKPKSQVQVLRYSGGSILTDSLAVATPLYIHFGGLGLSRPGCQPGQQLRWLGIVWQYPGGGKHARVNKSSPLETCCQNHNSTTTQPNTPSTQVNRSWVWNENDFAHHTTHPPHHPTDAVVKGGFKISDRLVLAAFTKMIITRDPIELQSNVRHFWNLDNECDVGVPLTDS